MATPAHVPPADGLRNVLSCESVRSLAALVLEAEADTWPEHFGCAYEPHALAEQAAEAERHAASALVRAAAFRRMATHPRRAAMHADHLASVAGYRPAPVQP